MRKKMLSGVIQSSDNGEIRMTDITEVKKRTGLRNRLIHRISALTNYTRGLTRKAGTRVVRRLPVEIYYLAEKDKTISVAGDGKIDGPIYFYRGSGIIEYPDFSNKTIRIQTSVNDLKPNERIAIRVPAID